MLARAHQKPELVRRRQINPLRSTLGESYRAAPAPVRPQSFTPPGDQRSRGNFRGETLANRGAVAIIMATRPRP
jgi:hypothetical protein